MGKPPLVPQLNLKRSVEKVEESFPIEITKIAALKVQIEKFVEGPELLYEEQVLS